MRARRGKKRPSRREEGAVPFYFCSGAVPFYFWSGPVPFYFCSLRCFSRILA